MNSGWELRMPKSKNCGIISTASSKVIGKVTVPGDVRKKKMHILELKLGGYVPQNMNKYVLSIFLISIFFKKKKKVFKTKKKKKLTVLAGLGVFSSSGLGLSSEFSVSAGLSASPAGLIALAGSTSEQKYYLIYK